MTHQFVISSACCQQHQPLAAVLEDSARDGRQASLGCFSHGDLNVSTTRITNREITSRPPSFCSTDPISKIWITMRRNSETAETTSTPSLKAAASASSRSPYLQLICLLPQNQWLRHRRRRTRADAAIRWSMMRLWFGIRRTPHEELVL